jgi:hypothetical protein
VALAIRWWPSGPVARKKRDSAGEIRQYRFVRATNESTEQPTAAPSPLPLVPSRPFGRAWCLAALTCWGCSVYTSDLLAPDTTLSAISGGSAAISLGPGSAAGLLQCGGSSSAGAAGNVFPGGASGSVVGIGGARSSGGASSIGGSASSDQAGEGGVGIAERVDGGQETAGNSSGGSGGEGGLVVRGPRCSDYPLTPKPTWIASASEFSLGSGVARDVQYNPPAQMIDGNFTTRWSTGKAQFGNEWVEIDFGSVVAVTDVTLNVNTDVTDYPRAYVFRLSGNSHDEGAPSLAAGSGAPGNLVVHFANVQTGRYLFVRQTAAEFPETRWWSIAEILVTCEG